MKFFKSLALLIPFAVIRSGASSSSNYFENVAGGVLMKNPEFQNMNNQNAINEFFTKVPDMEVEVLDEDYEFNGIKLEPKNQEFASRRDSFYSVNNANNENFYENLEIADEIKPNKEAVLYKYPTNNLEIRDEIKPNKEASLQEYLKEKTENRLSGYTERQGEKNMEEEGEFEEIKLDDPEQESQKRENVNPENEAFKTKVKSALLSFLKFAITGVGAVTIGGTLAVAGGFALAGIGAVAIGAGVGATVGGLIGGALGFGVASAIGTTATVLTVSGALVGGTAGAVKGTQKGYGLFKKGAIAFSKATGLTKLFEFGKKIGTKLFSKKQAISDMEHHNIKIRNIAEDNYSDNRSLSEKVNLKAEQYNSRIVEKGDDLSETSSKYEDARSQVSEYEDARSHLSDDDFKSAKSHLSEDDFKSAHSELMDDDDFKSFKDNKSLNNDIASNGEVEQDLSDIKFNGIGKDFKLRARSRSMSNLSHAEEYKKHKDDISHEDEGRSH